MPNTRTGTALSIETGGSGGGQLGIGDDCDAWEPRRVSHIQTDSGAHLPQMSPDGHILWRVESLSLGLNHSAAIIELFS